MFVLSSAWEGLPASCLIEAMAVEELCMSTEAARVALQRFFEKIEIPGLVGVE